MTPARAGGALIPAGPGESARDRAAAQGHGFRVTITDIDRDAGAQARDELQVEFIAGDSTSEADMCRAVERSGPVEVLVNNVGIRGATGAIWEIPIEDFRQTLEANTVSHIFMSQLVAPMMIERRSGVIIMIASGAARTDSVGRSPYGISKWGVLGLTESLANELAPWGIRANAVLPGMVAGKRFEGSIALHAEREGISQQEALRGSRTRPLALTWASMRPARTR
jgi:NAD(P)-dependent dehydrogenase (short-subunit alcohol dehydrogenase family)